MSPDPPSVSPHGRPSQSEHSGTACDETPVITWPSQVNEQTSLDWTHPPAPPDPPLSDPPPPDPPPPDPPPWLPQAANGATTSTAATAARSRREGRKGIASPRLAHVGMIKAAWTSFSNGCATQAPRSARGDA